VRGVMRPVCALLLLTACDREWLTDVGDLLPGEGLPVLEAPAVVRAEESFTVTVTTYGSSNCTRALSLTVIVDDLRATLIPYDSRVSAGGPCTSDLAAFPRTGRVTFARPGQGTLVVRGAGTYRVEFPVLVRE